MIWIGDLLLLALVVGVDRRVSGRQYSPLSLFAVAWLGPLALRHLGLVDYEPLRGPTLIMVYGGFAAFTLGYALIIMAAIRHWRPRSDEELLARLDPSALTVVTGLVAVLGLVATAIQVRSVISSRGLIGFLVKPLEVREEFMLTGWGVLFLMNFLLPGLLILRYRALGNRVDKWTVILFLIAITSLILANQKQALVKAGVIAAVMATLCESRVRLRNLVLVGLALLLFFVGYARVTSPYYKGDHRFYVRDGHIELPHLLAPLGNPYHYLTSGYGNLQVFVDDLDQFSDGRQSARPLRYVWLRLQGSREIETHHGRYYYAPLFGNTHTYLRQFYADGGVPLALILSLVLGLGCGWVYAEIVWRGHIWLAPVYGICGWCLFISFFSNHWVYFSTWILMAFGLILGLAISVPHTIRLWHVRQDRLVTR